MENEIRTSYKFLKDDNFNNANLNEKPKKENKKKKSRLDKFIENLKPGISVGLLNLALCISIPVASESNPEAGILSGIIAGIVSGFFAGSKYNIVGPSGTLSGIVSALVFKYGIYSIPYFTFATGVIAFIFKYFKLEQQIDIIPTAVNEGFKLGVAFLLFYSQINSAVGYSRSQSSKNKSSFLNDFLIFIQNFGTQNLITFFVFIIFLLSLTYLLKNYPTIPWIIISAFIGIFLGFFGLPVDTLKTKYGDLSLKLANFTYLYESNPILLLDPFMWLDALPLAIVVVIETLVTAKIVDDMAGTKFNREKELTSLSFTNLLAGLLGGIPISGTLGRATLNLKSGGNHRYAALVNSIILFAFGMIFFSFFKYLPLCVVASQLCTTAILMVNFPEMKKLLFEDKKKFIYLICIGFIFIWRDPVQGVIFGMFVFFIEFQKQSFIPRSEFIKVENFNPQISNEVNLTNSINNNKLSFSKSDYVIFRIFGILNSQNLDTHLNKIKCFLRENDHSLCICLKYTICRSKEVFDQIRILSENIRASINFNKVGQCPILIIGVPREEIINLAGNDWIFNMRSLGVSIAEETFN